MNLNSSVLSRFLNVKNVSAERGGHWTPRELQTVGAVAQNTLAANDIVASCCCRRAEVEHNLEKRKRLSQFARRLLK